MKSIIKSLLIVFILITIVSQATLAAFTASATITGNTFSTGNAALQILSNQVESESEFEVLAVSAGSFVNISPGWTQDFGVKVENIGTVDLVTTASNVVIEDVSGLGTELEVEIFAWDDANNDWIVDSGEVGASYGSPQTLDSWIVNPVPLAELESGAVQQLVLRFTAPEDLDNEFQDKTASFNFVFNGTTTGATQE